MKRRMIYFILSIISLMIGAFGIETVKADLYISNYHIIANVQPNGDVQFAEQIEFDADGKQNGVYYNLDYKGEKKPIDIYVTNETGQVLTNSYAETPNTYTLEDSDDYLKFKIYYPFNYERRTLTIHYTIPQLITNYQDVAEFNRVLVGEGWEIDQQNILFTLTLPAEADFDSLRAWAHGSAQGTVTIHDDYRGVTMEAPFNRAGEKIEARVIFPTSLTAVNQHVVSQTAKDRILAEEAELARFEVQKEEQKKAIGQVATFGGVGSFVMILVASFISFNKGYLANKKRMAAVPHVPDHLFELPEDITPAVMTQAIYLKKANKKDWSATVMDLVRKGFLTISDTEPYQLIRVAGGSGELRLHEEWLLNFLINEVGDGSQVYLDDLEEYADNHPSDYISAIEEFEENVEIEAKPFLVTNFEANESTGRSLAGGILPIFASGMFLLSTFSLYQAPNWWWVLAVCAIIFAILSIIWSGIFTVRRSVQGEYRYRLWQAFRQMLVDISRLDVAEVPSIVLWDHFLVYAISLGVAKHVIKVLTSLIPEQLKESTFYSSQYGWQMMVYHRAIHSSFSRSYQTATVHTSIKSNASGHGGGFSSGGFSGGSGARSGGGGF